jgi:FG-GAP repeat/PKD domain
MHNTTKEKLLVFVGVIFILSSCIPNAIGSTKAKADNKTTVRWSQVAKLLPGDGSGGDFFGSVSFDGNNAFIGSPKDDDNGGDSGSVYVFTNTSGTWVQSQKLLASDGAAGDWFGISVSVDGDTALIGSFLDDDNGADSGSAYIFIFNGTTWTQQAKLRASDGSAGDWFGYSVSLDGNTALVGAGFTSAYVFIREGDIWSQQAILTPSSRVTCDALGCPVAISNNTALFESYVFTCTSGIWSQQAHLVASDTESNDNYGWSSDLDGNSAIIGAPFDDDLGINSGSAYVFTRTGDTWSQQAKLLAFDGYDADLFGFSVAINGDRAFVGAADKNSGMGAGYGFLRQGTEWIGEGKAVASDGAPMDYFGWSVDLKGDTVVIGAHYDDDQGQDSGSAYVFTKSENQPPAPPTITGPAKGKVGVATTYNFTTTDPNGDAVSYFVDWGDGTNSSWIGPYPSGDKINQSHNWSKKGTYTIKAKARDIDWNESDWGTFSVTMPTSYNIPFQLFWERFFERFPNAFPILRYTLNQCKTFFS